MIDMRDLALETFDLHVERVMQRADMGGHSAPISVLRRIYEASLRNLPRAFEETDVIRVYDNSAWGTLPRLLLHAEAGEIAYVDTDIPAWFRRVLRKI